MEKYIESAAFRERIIAKDGPTAHQKLLYKRSEIVRSIAALKKKIKQWTKDNPAAPATKSLKAQIERLEAQRKSVNYKLKG